MKMPTPDAQVIAQREQILQALGQILPVEQLITAREQMKAYESDGVLAYQQIPLAVCLPDTTEDVSQILKVCQAYNVKLVPRGAGTSLSGGALPVADGILLSLARFNQILDVDYENQCCVVQPGVTNLNVTQAVSDQGFYYAPDPSSQIACTIGGNIAANAGGVHCLKYGVTANHIMGVEMVLPSGEILRIGGKYISDDGLDLLGILTGSEGLLGIVTEVTLRILPKPEVMQAVLLGFPEVGQAANFVGAVIEAGIIPAGMEMMDKFAIEAAEAFVQVGYPLNVDALVIVELDGSQIDVDILMQLVTDIAEKYQADSIRVSQNETERQQFWAGRKSAFPAIGRLTPDYYCMDGTIPRGKLPEVLEKMDELSRQYGLRVANVFHAGDGNLHPLIMYDANIPGDLEKAEAFGADILRACVAVGGVLTGEHGVGVEKRDLMPEMFSDIDLKQQQRLKCAFDPTQLMNPGKVFPTLHRCAELGRMHIHKGQVPHPDIPRF